MANRSRANSTYEWPSKRGQVKLKTIGNRARAKGALASRTADLQLVNEAIEELEIGLSAVSDGYWKTYYSKELVGLREIQMSLSDD